VAWPEPPLPPESVGESAVELDEPELDEPELDEPELDDELVDVSAFAVPAALEVVAYATAPTATVPARLAAISAPVITLVRLRPWSRSMTRLPNH
jgi:hypothetical protein